MTPTPENTFDPHEAARQVVLSRAENIVYGGIGEQLGDDWETEGLTEDEWDARQREVYDLATSATVTVSWPEDGDITIRRFIGKETVDGETIAYEGAQFTNGASVVFSAEHGLHAYATEAARDAVLTVNWIDQEAAPLPEESM